jgi:hypothetical protein
MAKLAEVSSQLIPPPHAVIAPLTLWPSHLLHREAGKHWGWPWLLGAIGRVSGDGGGSGSVVAASAEVSGGWTALFAAPAASTVA